MKFLFKCIKLVLEIISINRFITKFLLLLYAKQRENDTESHSCLRVRARIIETHCQ